jgi:hypothetical protein
LPDLDSLRQTLGARPSRPAPRPTGNDALFLDVVTPPGFAGDFFATKDAGVHRVFSRRQALGIDKYIVAFHRTPNYDMTYFLTTKKRMFFEACPEGSVLNLDVSDVTQQYGDRPNAAILLDNGDTAKLSFFVKTDAGHWELTWFGLSERVTQQLSAFVDAVRSSKLVKDPQPAPAAPRASIAPTDVSPLNGARATNNDNVPVLAADGPAPTAAEVESTTTAEVNKALQQVLDTNRTTLS